MEMSFHYFGTFCAAQLAGYDYDKSLRIAWAAQMPDACTKPFLEAVDGPLEAATTQSGVELAGQRTDLLGRQEVCRIWSSFHFLPYDLAAEVGRGGRSYKERFRLICDVNGALVKEIVELARDHGPEAAGIAMHTLADTWAHRFFCGVPSLVINGVSSHFFEIVEEEGRTFERPVHFRLAADPDDVEAGLYQRSPYHTSEHAIMNLGHGRAGHLPDYSFCRYRYLPAWGDYDEIVKDNPHDFWQAFSQMTYALACLREGVPFELDTYAEAALAPHEARIRQMIAKRQKNAAPDWAAFAADLAGAEVPAFDRNIHNAAYMGARDDEERDKTLLGRFIVGALAQKALVTQRIWESGNRLAGRSIRGDAHIARSLKDYLLSSVRVGGGSRE